MTFSHTILRIGRKHILFAACGLSLYSSAAVRGADRTFDNNAGVGSSIWNINTNWSDDLLPTSTDTAIIPSGIFSTNSRSSVFITAAGQSTSAAVKNLIITAPTNQFGNLRSSHEGSISSTLIFGNGTLTGTFDLAPTSGESGFTIATLDALDGTLTLEPVSKRRS